MGPTFAASYTFEIRNTLSSSLITESFVIGLILMTLCARVDNSNLENSKANSANGTNSRRIFRIIVDE